MGVVSTFRADFILAFIPGRSLDTKIITAGGD
jgi:hypothetical protein